MEYTGYSAFNALLTELDGLKNSAALRANDLKRSDELRAASRSAADTYGYCQMRLMMLDLKKVDDKMNIVEKLEAYKLKGNPLKAEYVEYIKDKTIPLDDRWEAFRAAPSEFKEHSSWVEHFDAERLLPAREIAWYDFGYERHQTVYMYDFVCDTLDDMLDDFDEDEKKKIVDAFKEAVLQRNLESFDYDW